MFGFLPTLAKILGLFGFLEESILLNLGWIHFEKNFGPFFFLATLGTCLGFFAFAGIVPASKFCLVGGALVGAWAEKFRVRFPRGGPVQHILLDIDDDEDDEHEENQKNDEDDEDEDEDDEDDDENGDDDEFNLRMIKDEER